jgi:hypothetical protein
MLRILDIIAALFFIIRALSTIVLLPVKYALSASFLLNTACASTIPFPSNHPFHSNNTHSLVVRATADDGGPRCIPPAHATDKPARPAPERQRLRPQGLELGPLSGLQEIQNSAVCSMI